MDDRRAIEDVLARFIYGLDRLGWALVETALTEDFRYGFKEADAARWVWFEGRAEMVRRIRPIVEAARTFQHICPNPLIELAGDAATLLVNHMAYEWQDGPADRPPQMRMLAGRWEGHLRRTSEEGWRFTGVVFDPTFLFPWADDLRAFPPRGPANGVAW
ncbi:nuclear transport factor 2 family protein [Pseudonocardia hispaniensis]|uniref:Nuclear transport factor 2 family protein n=1 Tax=Pseudonocardia hispaniensis TaxID=904933 RepID=A0ABW1J5I0_9PSEU